MLYNKNRCVPVICVSTQTAPHRWQLVVHGGIDGYSRAITFLRCHTNNSASTVFHAFQEGVEKYGLPTKVRTDHGGENIEV